MGGRSKGVERGGGPGSTAKAADKSQHVVVYKAQCEAYGTENARLRCRQAQGSHRREEFTRGRPLIAGKFRYRGWGVVWANARPWI